MEQNQANGVSGNILLFYAFDIGDEVDLNSIKNNNLVSTFIAPQSFYFKNYHVPLSFRMLKNENGEIIEREDSVLNKIHHFGTLSFCYKIPFDDSLENLKQKIIKIKESYDKQSVNDAKEIFDKIRQAIGKPRFYNLKHDYFAVHVNPLKDQISADEFKRMFKDKIASLLRLEVQSLSDYQVDDILSSTIGYYGQDLVIIDSEASFIYDDEYFEPMEFFETTNIQLLTLQYYDRFLDKKLTFFYKQKSHKVSLISCIPFVGNRVDLAVSNLARLKVDISVITERLENSIKITGDAYYSKMYSMLVERLSITEWRDSINRKLDIIWDLYTVHQNHLDTIHEEILTVVIIVLIAIEIITTFWH